jgi:hypothetical protein
MTLHGMLAQTYEEDKARGYEHPGRRHAAEFRRSRPQRSSRLRTVVAKTLGRLNARPAAATSVPCTTADGRTGRLVARFEGAQRVFVCEIG